MAKDGLDLLRLNLLGHRSQVDLVMPAVHGQPLALHQCIHRRDRLGLGLVRAAVHRLHGQALRQRDELDAPSALAHSVARQVKPFACGFIGESQQQLPPQKMPDGILIAGLLFIVQVALDDGDGVDLDEELGAWPATT